MKGMRYVCDWEDQCSESALVRKSDATNNFSSFKVWTWIEEMLRRSEAGPAPPQPTEDEPAAKKSFLLLCSSDSDSDKEEQRPLARYKAEPCIRMHECPLEWWAAHAGAYGELSSLARKYLATPATSVPCERLFSLAGNIIQKKPYTQTM